jgi:hypothetical protein
VLCQLYVKEFDPAGEQLSVLKADCTARRYSPFAYLFVIFSAASAPSKKMLQKLLQYLRQELCLSFPAPQQRHLLSSFFFLLYCAHRSGEQRAAAQALVDRKGSMSVKYTPFNFQCKYPVKLRDSSLKSVEL